MSGGRVEFLAGGRLLYRSLSEAPSGLHAAVRLHRFGRAEGVAGEGRPVLSGAAASWLPPWLPSGSDRDV